MKVKLIVGLGNPDKQYENTYHNVGFLAVDYLKYQMVNSKHKIEKSEVFMNQSGNFVRKALKKYKIKPEELMIIHDDSDIELGKCKISFGRGSAGHKGVQSIIDALATKDFWRLRIGIRKDQRAKASQLVLKKIGKKDLEIFDKVFKKIKDEF